jgi:hypothetical protein
MGAAGDTAQKRRPDAARAGLTQFALGDKRLRYFSPFMYFSGSFWKSLMQSRQQKPMTLPW